MLTAEAKAKKVATAEKRLASLNAKRETLEASLGDIVRDIRLATRDLEHRKAAPVVDEDEDPEVTVDGVVGTRPDDSEPGELVTLPESPVIA